MLRGKRVAVVQSHQQQQQRAPPRRRPAWDGAIHDLGRYRLSEREMRERREALVSKNAEAARRELHEKQERLQRGGGDDGCGDGEFDSDGVVREIATALDALQALIEERCRGEDDSGSYDQQQPDEEEDEGYEEEQQQAPIPQRQGRRGDDVVEAMEEHLQHSPARAPQRTNARRDGNEEPTGRIVARIVDPEDELRAFQQRSALEPKPPAAATFRPPQQVPTQAQLPRPIQAHSPIDEVAVGAQSPMDQTPLQAIQRQRPVPQPQQGAERESFFFSPRSQLNSPRDAGAPGSPGRSQMRLMEALGESRKETAKLQLLLKEREERLLVEVAERQKLWTLLQQTRAALAERDKELQMLKSTTVPRRR